MKQIHDRLYNQSNVTFEPTLNFFKNAIVINYKKVGTRFLREIVSYPNDVNIDNKQVDIQYRRDQFKSHTYSLNNLHYLDSNHYIQTPWDWVDNLDIVKSYKDWNDLDSFLKYQNVNNFTELLLENSDKEIVLLMRNPIERFFSGIVQVLLAFIEDLKTNQKERNGLKLIMNKSDSDIDNLINNLENSLYIKHNNPMQETITPYINYLIDYKWDLILQDIHTENYLHHYIELIYNIKDKSKIKIIDLKDCNSDSAYNFFSELRGDNELEMLWSDRKNKIDSNKNLYNIAIDTPQTNMDSAIFHYLKGEYGYYERLTNSKYFVKI
jgi:hypothetical protein